MRLTLIETWREDLHRLWSLRVALFMFVLTGGLTGLGALQNELNPYLFAGLQMFGWALVGFLRLVKQAPRAEL